LSLHEAPEPGNRIPASLVSSELSAEPAALASIGAEADIGRPGWAQVFRALRHRNFQLFVAGQTISLIGTFMQTVAQSWLVYRLTRSEWLLGATWFCTQIPVFVLGPLGGLAADRCSRHRIVVATQALAMLQALLLAALTLTGTVQVWHVLVLAVMLGTVNAFDMPGRQSLLIQMVGKDDLLSAISLNSAIFNAARMVGPAVAGVAVAAVGEGLCFLANGVSFVAVIGSLLAMRLPKFIAQNRESPWAHLVGGFRYAYGQPAIMALLAMVAAASLSGMPALVLMPFFADDIFHRGSQGLGFLMGAMGIGAVIGTLVLARRAKTSGLVEVIFLGALTFGASFLVLAGSPSFYLALAIMPVVGFSIMRHNAAANTLIQVIIPDEYRGRIMALYSMTVVGIGPFGSLATGALAGRFGARTTVMCGGILCLIAVCLFRLRVRKLPELR
jgi:predicted MFS family arabinose efflux permease